jgi:hypothetical protein
VYDIKDVTKPVFLQYILAPDEFNININIFSEFKLIVLFSAAQINFYSSINQFEMDSYFRNPLEFFDIIDVIILQSSNFLLVCEN